MFQLTLVMAVSFSALAVFPVGARAEPTRAEYVAQADALCHSQLTSFREDTAKLRAATKKLRLHLLTPNDQQKADSPRLRKQFKPTGRFYRLGAAFTDTLTDSLSQLAVPSADAETITKWLASRRVLAHQYRLLGKAYPQRKLRRIYKLILAMYKSAGFPPQALNSFGFQYCYGQHANPFSAN